MRVSLRGVTLVRVDKIARLVDMMLSSLHLLDYITVFRSAMLLKKKKRSEPQKCSALVVWEKLLIEGFTLDESWLY